MSEVAIEALGAAGDGIATLDGRRVYVPWTMPGERWRVRVAGERGEALERLAGPPRRSPECRHFTRCGGCALQHLPDPLYRSFKRERIVTALRRAGVAVGRLHEVVVSPPASRRRLRLGWSVGRGAMRLGHRRRRSRELVDIAECPIARPELIAPLPELRAALPALAARGEILLTLTEGGIDLLITADAPLELRVAELLAGLAEKLDLARLALRVGLGAAAEPVLIRRPPLLRFGPATVVVPPGAFLQATAEGEQALRSRLVAWLPPDARVVEGHAGCGSFTFTLAAAAAAVRAIDADPAAIGALAAAARSEGQHRITTTVRDLERDPLDAAELAADRATVAILDPPRTGAPRQAAALATAALERILYVSCDPASFARDARLLAAGGWRLAEVQPVDQFLFSAEIELAARFERAGADP